MLFCRKELNNISKYKSVSSKFCHLPKNHDGKCMEFPFLDHLFKVSPRVANKIKRDSTMTTGAAWKSKDAGPNRIPRWIMLLNDRQLKTFGIDMNELKTGVISKLKDKAATYEECINVSIKLTHLTYQMIDAPKCRKDIKEYIESFYGKLKPHSTDCIICKKQISFDLFDAAKRGKAEIETAHKDPRSHNPDNIGFAHRECNIAQGNKTLEEFYKWITEIVKRVEKN